MVGEGSLLNQNFIVDIFPFVTLSLGPLEAEHALQTILVKMTERAKLKEFATFTVPRSVLQEL